MTKPDLVDLQLIAKRLGVPYDTVNKWRFRGILPPPDYPELRNPIWDWETIEAWAKTTDRLPDKETTHACPPGGSGVTPCCGRTPFELSTSDRMTTDPALVTCLPDKETPNE